MIVEDTVYCVSCNHIVPAERASKKFRTGYYKCQMRLGLCDACVEAEFTEHNAASHDDPVGFSAEML